jgi:hypothetical protein
MPGIGILRSEELVMETTAGTGAMTTRRDAGGFDWRVYSDATCAGLSALIPIPLVDLVFEGYFRRRMPATIARVRGRDLDRWDRIRLGRGHGVLVSVAGCLAIPVMAVRYVLRRLWRKIIYIFAVADATGLVSEYWHRAYLLDHTISAGHFAPEADRDRAVRAFGQALREADTSPLLGLARQMVSGTRRVFRVLLRARRRGASEETGSLAEVLGSHWASAERSMQAVAIRYNDLYAAASDEGDGRPTSVRPRD